jgi:hypothetical protein
MEYPCIIDSLLSYVYLINSLFLGLLFSCFWLLLSGSLFFDIVYYFLHQCSKSRHRRLRLLGYLHQVHHLYFNRRLKFNNKYHWHNLLVELPIELCCQLLGTWLGFIGEKAMRFKSLGPMSIKLLTIVLLFEMARVLLVAVLSGHDSN